MTEHAWALRCSCVLHKEMGQMIMYDLFFLAVIACKGF